ncbi:hypothetical protein ACFPC0_30810 [Streptomyces andamanensis]|uniref:Uncharacterized protein n=1 Tax=Streptomyces andamanensis TaxID=1565035 RepID=A0ABV8TNU6_9ACTN
MSQASSPANRTPGAPHHRASRRAAAALGRTRGFGRAFLETLKDNHFRAMTLLMARANYRRLSDMIAAFAQDLASPEEVEKVRRRVGRGAMRSTLNRANRLAWAVTWIYYPMILLLPWMISLDLFSPPDSGSAHGDQEAVKGISFDQLVTLGVPLGLGYVLVFTAVACRIKPRTEAIHTLKIIRKVRHRVLPVMVLVDSFIIWTVTDTSSGYRPVVQCLAWFALGGAAAALHLLMSLAFAALLKYLFYPRITEHDHPYDELLVAMTMACSKVHSSMGQPFRSTRTRAALVALEAAAGTAEVLALKFSRSASIFDRESRSIARREAFGVADVIRKHKYVLSRAGGPGSHVRVMASLWAGITALTQDDWESVVAQIDQAPRISKIHAAWQRLLPPLVLLTAAFALPLIPDVARIPTVAGSLRITLLITAALTLVLPRESSARAPILDALGKALPIGSQK